MIIRNINEKFDKINIIKKLKNVKFFHLLVLLVPDWLKRIFVSKNYLYENIKRKFLIIFPWVEYWK
jgi:hypothetical protein